MTKGNRNNKQKKTAPSVSKVSPPANSVLSTEKIANPSATNPVINEKPVLNGCCAEKTFLSAEKSTSCTINGVTNEKPTNGVSTQSTENAVLSAEKCTNPSAITDDTKKTPTLSAVTTNNTAEKALSTEKIPSPSASKSVPNGTHSSNGAQTNCTAKTVLSNEKSAKPSAINDDAKKAPTQSTSKTLSTEKNQNLSATKRVSNGTPASNVAQTNSTSKTVLSNEKSAKPSAIIDDTKKTPILSAVSTNNTAKTASSTEKITSPKLVTNEKPQSIEKSKSPSAIDDVVNAKSTPNGDNGTPKTVLSTEKSASPSAINDFTKKEPTQSTPKTVLTPLSTEKCASPSVINSATNEKPTNDVSTKSTENAVLSTEKSASPSAIIDVTKKEPTQSTPKTDLSTEKSAKPSDIIDDTKKTPTQSSQKTVSTPLGTEKCASPSATIDVTKKTPIVSINNTAKTALSTEKSKNIGVTNQCTVVQRLLSFTSNYLKCEVTVYDENLHQAISKMIERLEEFGTENESIPDELRQKVIERHIELLNVRIKLIKMCQSSLESQSSALANSIALTEPEIPNEIPKLVNFKCSHPRELYMNLLNAGHLENEALKYTLSITVNVFTSMNSALARVFINFTSGIGCFVSPKFLERLNIRPIKLQKPMLVGSAYGNHSVQEYVVLEIRSLYREPYRFTSVFYVNNIDSFSIDPPSESVIQMAEQKGAKLSHTFDADQSHDHCDMVIGHSHVDLTGFNMANHPKVELKDDSKGIEVDCYYSHFGYVLSGKDSSNLIKQ